jgi:hypothetical protein
MTERHYHIVVDDETGHATMVRLDGLANNAKASWVIPTRADREAQKVFVQALVDNGSAPRVHTQPGESVRSGQGVPSPRETINDR